MDIRQADKKCDQGVVHENQDALAVMGGRYFDGLNRERQGALSSSN
jgi:hypothetical protein